jgi:hypothetical protein
MATFGPGVARASILTAMGVIGSGMGLAMLTLLIAVQVAAPRGQLGVVTSLNQFWRSIGGAIGVAVMGAVLASSLASRISAAGGDSVARFAGDPNAILDPAARAALRPEVLATLETALADSLRGAFALAAAAAVLAVVAALFLPKRALGSRG